MADARTLGHSPHEQNQCTQNSSVETCEGITNTCRRAAPAQMAPYRILCHNCNYDLRGIDPHGVCPECAKPIRASIRAARVRRRRVLRIKRRVSAYKWWDVVFLAAFLICAGMLYYESWMMRRPTWGHTFYRPTAFLGATLHIYLSFRYRALATYSGWGVLGRVVLLVLLFCLSGVLFLGHLFVDVFEGYIVDWRYRELPW